MASISTTTINQLYDIKGDVQNAALALERYALVKDAGAAPQADAAVSKALASLSGFVAGGTSTVITTAVKVTAPVTGSGTSGVTPTIVNGVVTGWVLS